MPIYQNTRMALLFAPVPVAPSGLAATAIAHDRINLSWTDNSGNEDSFELQYDTDSEFGSPTSIELNRNVTAYNLYGLPDNQIQYFRIRAVNDNGNSSWSATDNATTSALTVDFPFTAGNQGFSDAQVLDTAGEGRVAGEIITHIGSGTMAISSNVMVFTPDGSSDWTDTGIFGRNDDDSGFSRGAYFQYEFTVATSGYISGSWINNTSLALANMKHAFFIFASGGSPSRAILLRDVLSVSSAAGEEYVGYAFDDTTYTVRIYTISGGGAIWLIKGGQYGTEWKTLGYSDQESDATIYPHIAVDEAGEYNIDNYYVAEVAAPSVYVAYYNGATSVGGTYEIGRGCSYDGISVGRQVSNPVMTVGTGGSWDDALIQHPYVLKDGATWKMWYSGQDGAIFKIGYATSADGITWTKSVSNPVLSVGGGGAWDENSVLFPTVYKDAGAAAAKRWKMLYSGQNAAGKTQIGYAYSADGISWSKGGSNPVLSNGSGGESDDEGLIAGSLVEDNNIFYFYYGGREETTFPFNDQTMLATFTDFEGTYTKHGLMLLRRNAYIELTANLTAGSTTVTLTDSSGFVANEVVCLLDTTDQIQQVQIASITDATHLELKSPAIVTFTTANVAKIQATLRATTPRFVVKENGVWKMWLTAFQIGKTSSEVETSYYASSIKPASGWTFEHESSPPLWLPGLGQVYGWDELSAENIVFAIDADTMERITE